LRKCDIEVWTQNGIVTEIKPHECSTRYNVKDEKKNTVLFK